MEKLIFHVDVNSAYLSWEAARRVANGEEDIRLMIDSGSEQGSIDSMEQEMIRNIFEFDDISLGEVCTHRRDVTFLYKKDSIEEWKTIRKEQKSMLRR